MRAIVKLASTCGQDSLRFVHEISCYKFVSPVIDITSSKIIACAGCKKVLNMTQMYIVWTVVYENK